MTRVPTITLNNGIQMPILGLGVFQIPDPEECERVVADALRIGYRLIDTAAAYGNEEAVGKAIRESGIPRGEIFLTTKLWISDASEERATVAFEKSLERLGLEYIDLYLIHQPVGDVYGAWRSMERVYQDGRAKAIGVSNFHTDRLIDLAIHNEITPAVNQIEVNPWHQRIDDQAFMAEQGIQTMAWAPFAEGKNDLFTNPILGKIASKHGVSVAQVVVAWLLHRGIVAIPKSVRGERMQENLNVFNIQLDEQDLAAITSLDTQTSSFFNHRDPAMIKYLAELSRNV